MPVILPYFSGRIQYMKFNQEKPKILVVGSCSLDLVLNTAARPNPGETVIATQSENFFGGKGANQAVCAARLGASSYLIGCVGQDPAGQQILRNLVEENVNVGFVYESEDEATGAAYVFAAEGQNSIIVVPAANFQLSESQIAEAEKYFGTADIILLQLEIPAAAIEFTVETAKKFGKEIGIYASPAKFLSPEIVDYASFVVAKSGDLREVFGSEDKAGLLYLYPNKLFIRDEACCTEYFDGHQIKKVSETRDVPHKMGIGDAFCAAFAVALTQGNSVEECVDFAKEISFHAGQRRGSQTGLPYLEDIIS